nr:winged helix-turn-helix domain-containing protein [Aliikangiella sp. G2MR2-5]
MSPTLHSLLRFFIDNQNTVLTKEQIINHVWKGKIVVEANVNQNIKKLRDALGDSVNSPRYIETVTGEGFRFIANSEAYKATPVESKTKKSVLLIFLLSVIFVLALITLFNRDKSESINFLKELHPITTLKGIELYPEISPDKKYLLFNHKKSGSWDIYIRPIGKESYKVLLGSEMDELFPALSPSGNKLSYFISSKSGVESECGLYIADINFESLELTNSRLVKSCVSSQSRMSAEWIDEDNLFMSINEDVKSPANIYKYEISSKVQTLISKPDTKGFGDYIITVSEDREYLAYVRDIAWSSSEIWVYSLSEKNHRRVKSTPLLLSGIDWQDGWIYFQSGSHEISRIDKFGANEQIVAKTPQSIYLPFAIDDSKMGVVVGDMVVVDISRYDIEKKLKDVIISSSFNDYNGAGAGGNVIFVSNRSGNPQIWMKNGRSETVQITSFDKSYELSWLSLSSNGQFVIFGKSGQINVVDLDGNTIFNSEDYTEQVQNNPVIDIENGRFFYSIQYAGQWTIESRYFASLGEKHVLFQGITARPCLSGECLLYFREKDPYIYKYNPSKNTSLKLTKVAALMSSEQWDVYDLESIVFLEREPLSGKNKVVRLNIYTGEREVLLTTNAKSFSLDRKNKQIYINTISQGNTDILYFKR